MENEEILSIFEFRYKSNNTQYVRGKQGHMIHFSEGKSFSVDELYDRFYNELVLWADTILSDMEEAEDLVQDFFVRLWEKKLNENLEGERVRSYLYVAVRNMAVRKVKDQSRIRRIPDMSVVESVWENEDVTHDDMIDQEWAFELACLYHKAGMADKCVEACDVLPPRSREVLECVHLKNMKYVEVAELLGISVATVKTLLVRSLKTLRGIVSDTALLLVLVYREDGGKRSDLGMFTKKLV